MQNEKLSLKTKLGFGVCDLGGNLFFTMMAFWVMNYLTDTLGLMPALAGIALMIGRIWDAISDPLVGHLSDHTHTKWGRRRPFIFFGAIFLFIFMLIFFKNPYIKDQNILFLWVTINMLLLFTSYTLTSIPYSSLTPELTTDYNERTTLNSFRMTFAIIGTFIAGGLAQPIINNFSKTIEGTSIKDNSNGFFIMGVVFGFIMCVSALITVFSIKEKNGMKKKQKNNILSDFSGILKNKPYLLILFTYAFNIIAITILSGTLIYYFKYVFKNENLTTLSFIFLLVPAMLSIPAWEKISKKIGKKWAYFSGMAIVAISLIFNFIFADYIDARLFFLILIFTGIGFSTGYVLPWAIIPDTIDYDYLNTKTKNEGIYYGAWTFFSKTGQSIANFIIGILLQLSGFIPNVEQNDNVILTLKLLLGPIGILFYIIAMIILVFYPIDKKMHDEILDKIKSENL